MIRLLLSKQAQGKFVLVAMITGKKRPQICNSRTKFVYYIWILLIYAFVHLFTLDSDFIDVVLSFTYCTVLVSQSQPGFCNLEIHDSKFMAT